MAIVAKLLRGEITDLTYAGHIAVVDASGKLLYSYGNPERLSFVRSAAKLLQAIPVIESGAAAAFGLSPAELALICGSHSGEDCHVAAVRSILAKAGLDESYLQCGTHWPFAEYQAEHLRQQGQTPLAVHNNCSGKHAGMLITAKHLGEDLSSYYQIEHPVQQRILKTLGAMCQCDPAAIGLAVDGCGVPVHALPLKQFAMGYARLSKPTGVGDARAAALEQITRAVTAHPQMVAGTDRICTDLMRVSQGRLIAKAGADGYYAVGVLGKGIGLSFKMAGGQVKELNPVVLETLRQLDFLSQSEFAALRQHYIIENFNHKKERVGRLIVDFQLQKH